MTTIAFKNGVVAADRLTVEGTERYGYTTKIGIAIDADGAPFAFGASGCVALAQRFNAWAAKGFAKHDPPPTMVEGDAKAFGVRFYADGRMVSYDPAVPPYETTMHQDEHGAYYAAIGSGGEYALGAMASGCDARRAVEIATLFDTGSGGGVDVHQLPGD